VSRYANRSIGWYSSPYRSSSDGASNTLGTSKLSTAAGPALVTNTEMPQHPVSLHPTPAFPPHRLGEGLRSERQVYGDLAMVASYSGVVEFAGGATTVVEIDDLDAPSWRATPRLLFWNHANPPAVWLVGVHLLEGPRAGQYANADLYQETPPFFTGRAGQ
jgi:hypothetical protein